MHHFHTLRVNDVHRETPSCVSIAFDTSSQPDLLSFKPGQYLTLKLDIDGSEVRRSYSICSAPGSGELRIAAKAVDGGFASVYLNSRVSAGDHMEVMGPDGNFTPQLQSGQAKHYVLFGAGSGITPLKAIIHGILSGEPESQIHLFFGNRSREEIIFNESLEALAANNPRFSLTHVLTDGSLDAAHSGRIDREKTRTLLTGLQATLPREYFVCGPSGMMAAVLQGLTDIGVPSDNVHTEYFATPVEDGSEAAPTEVSAPEEAFTGESEVTIVLDDEEISFSLSENGPVVLDAAMDEGADVPFSCKGGVCTTCKAKLEEGSVKMDQNYALTEGEIAEGYILTCQSHPTSPKLRVNYDEV